MEDACVTSYRAARSDRATGILGQPLSSADVRTGSVRYDAARHELRQALEKGMISLVVIRHGKTDANARADIGQPVLCGQSHAALDATGRAQAQEAARGLYAALGADAWLLKVADGTAELPVVYASQLVRSQETAQPFVDHVVERARDLAKAGKISSERLAHIEAALTVRVSADLNEQSYGAFELKPLTALASELPEFSRNWQGLKFGGAGINIMDRFPDGESRFDVAQRTRRLFRSILREHDGRTVLCFCHLETAEAAKLTLGLAATGPDGVVQVAADVPNATPMWLTHAPR